MGADRKCCRPSIPRSGKVSSEQLKHKIGKGNASVSTALRSTPSEKGTDRMSEDFNPLAERVALATANVELLRATRESLTEQLNWYDSFDFTESEARRTGAETESAGIEDLLVEHDKAISMARDKARAVRPSTLPGWSPLYWFSDARAKAKAEYASHIAEAQRNMASKRQLKTTQAEIARRLEELRREAQLHRKFDRITTAGDLATCEVEIARHELLLAKLQPMCELIETELAPLRKEWSNVQAQIRTLEIDRSDAERFSRRLSGAPNNYEKAMIHQESERRFGEGSPAKVLNQIRKELPSKQREAQKLRRRMSDIGRRGALDIGELVIDGSNVCYADGDKFIGLFAVRALCRELQGTYPMTVVFDASIVKKLGLPSEATLRSQLPGVKVHVVPSGTSADETVLDLADKPNAYVISNDRFVDFPDKSAISGRRTIRHEIVGKRVLVRDLRVDVEYDNQK